MEESLAKQADLANTGRKYAAAQKNVGSTFVA
jgi:hypothetical protein